MNTNWNFSLAKAHPRIQLDFCHFLGIEDQIWHSLKLWVKKSTDEAAYILSERNTERDLVN